jgi:hypothetical protein
MIRRSERLMKKMGLPVDKQPISAPVPQPIQTPKPAPSSSSYVQENPIQTRNPQLWLHNYIQFTEKATGPEKNFRLFQLFQIILSEYPELLVQSQPFYIVFVQKLREFRSVVPEMFEQLTTVLPSIILLDM